MVSFFRDHCVPGLVHTNKLDADINYKAFFDHFAVLAITIDESEKYIPYYSSLFTDEELAKVLVSVFYDGSAGACRTMYGLVARNESFSETFVFASLAAVPELDGYTYRFLTATDFLSHKANPYVILNLLLFRTDPFLPDTLEIMKRKPVLDNLYGHLYVSGLGRKSISLDRQSGRIAKIVALELRIDHELMFGCSVRTFVNSMYFSDGDLARLADSPGFLFDRLKGFRRFKDKDKAEGNKTDVFYMALPATWKEKNNVPFLVYKDRGKFYASKMGLVWLALRTMNRIYKDFLKVRFVDYPCESLLSGSLLEKRHEAVQEGFFSNKTINLVRKYNTDRYSDDDFEASVVALRDYIESWNSRIYSKRTNLFWKGNFGLSLQVSDKVSDDPGMLNLIVVDDDEFDKDIKIRVKDNYAVYGSTVVQHIEVSNFFNANAKKSSDDERPERMPDVVFAKCFYELMLKNDLQNGRITSLDWASFGFTGPVKFSVRILNRWDENGNYINGRINEEDKEYHYFSLSVLPDGRFMQPDELKTDVAGCMFVSSEMEILRKIPHIASNVECVITYPDGSMNVIEKTGMWSVGDIDVIQQMVSEPNGYNRLRHVDIAPKAFGGLLGINAFMDDNNKLYYCCCEAIKVHNLNGPISRAPVFRQVHGVGSVPVQKDFLLDSMSVFSVRTHMFPVLPLPVKLLREWAYYYLRFGVNYFGEKIH